MTPVQLDFDQAREKHLLFKARLRSILYGSDTDDAPVLSHTECGVGKWIYSTALTAYGHIDEMQRLEIVHQDIHTSARRLVALYKEGKVEEARSGLAETEEIADQLVQLLTTVEKKIKEQPLPPASIASNAALIEFKEILDNNIELDKLIKQQISRLQTLKKSEEKYRFLFESTNQGICIVEVLFDENEKAIDYRFKEGNPVFNKLPGFENAIGKTILELVPDMEPYWIQTYGKVVQTGEPVQFVKESKAIGRWYSVDAFRIGNPDAREVGVLFNDITEARLKEDDLKESESRFSTLADQAPMIVFMVEPTADARISYFNQAWLSYTGQSFEQALGRAWDGIVHPDDVQGVLDVYVPAFEKQQPYYLPDIRLRRHDGVYRSHMFKGVPRFLPNGEYVGFIGIGLDVEDQKQAEIKLKESQQQFESLAENMPQLAWMADEKGWIYWYNQRWYEYTGTTPAEMEGWGWQKVHDPKVLPEVVERWTASINTGEPFEMVFPLKGTDGSFRPFLTRVTPIKDSNNHVVQWFGTNTDISEQKKTEEALRESEQRLQQSFEDLEVKVTFRNLELETLNQQNQLKIEELQNSLRKFREKYGAETNSI